MCVIFKFSEIDFWETSIEIVLGWKPQHMTDDESTLVQLTDSGVVKQQTIKLLYDCLNPREVTLKDIGKGNLCRITTKNNKTHTRAFFMECALFEYFTLTFWYRWVGIHFIYWNGSLKGVDFIFRK